MKKVFNITLIVSVLLVVVMVYCFNEAKRLSSYFKGDVLSTTIDQVHIQKKVNDELERAKKNKSYSIENAYVKLNPYEISPLSAIIIFYTQSEEEVEVFINDEFFTKMEKSKEHAIPIYGLYEDYDNVITLKINGKSYDKHIKTDASNIKYPLNISKNEVLNNENDLIFTVSSYETYFTGWDRKGKLRFYLTVDNRMDVEWLPNGHFLIGTSEGQVRENFLSLVEMDYLGKIYNYYNLEHGYGFEMQILKNGNYMLAGGDKAIYFDHQYIYEMNPSDGSVINELDIYDVIKKIDPEFLDEYLGQKAIRNGFFYNEETDELVVSFREINTIFCFNFKEKTLKYVFTGTSKLFSSSVWNQYLVKVKSGRYPMGQHTTTITKDGYLAFFNNGYDRYSITFDGLNNITDNFKDAYTSVEIYDIKNNVASLVWKEDFEKKYFSIKYGLFSVLENDFKFMNFGYILKDEFRRRSNSNIAETEKNVEDIYSRIIELDKDGKVVFEATCEEGKYRAFMHNLYSDNTKNVEIDSFNTIDTVSKSKLETTSVRNLDVDSSLEWINSLEFTKHTFQTNYKIGEKDEVKFHFLNNHGKVYTYIYKEKDGDNNHIFNLDLDKGNYRMFISINDQLYDTKKVYSF